MELVLNEWFLDYMVQDSSQRAIVHRVLDSIEIRADKLAVRVGSPFEKKFYRYCASHGAIGKPSRDVIRRFALLLRNSNTVRRVHDSEITPLPESLIVLVPNDDVYLAELINSTSDRLLVTTDEQLKVVLDGRMDMTIRLLEEFLNERGLG